MAELFTIYDDLGMDLENAIRNKILSNVPPPNAQSTIKSKGSSHTLIDTGTLLDSISYNVEINQDLISITSGILKDGEIAEYASYNEYGTAHIPERSFIRSTFDELFDIEIMEKFADTMQTFTKEKLSK